MRIFNKNQIYYLMKFVNISNYDKVDIIVLNFKFNIRFVNLSKNIYVIKYD